MRQIVADSSSLILLAKCSLLELLCQLFEVVIPPAVHAEVASEYLVNTYPDAALISGLISRGTMKIRNPVDRAPILPESLHRGEKEVLALSLQEGNCLFATDDGKAIKAARFFGVPFIVTPKIVVDLFHRNRITMKKARESLHKLSHIGRYSPEIIATALVALLEKENDETDNHPLA